MEQANDPLGIIGKTKDDPLGIISQPDDPLGILEPKPSSKFKDYVLKEVESTTRFYKNLGAEAASAFNRGLGAFAGSLDKMADYISETTGLPKGGAFEEAKRQAVENSEYWDSLLENSGFTEEMIGEFVGGAVPGIAEWAMGPLYAGAVGFAEEGPEGALKHGARRYILGKILHAANILKIPSRTAAMATTGAVQAAAEGAEPRDIAKSAGVMAGYGLTMGPGRMPFREAIRARPRPVKPPAPTIEQVKEAAEKPETEFLRKEFEERFVKPEPEVAPRAEPAKVPAVKEPPVARTLAELREVAEKELPKLRKVEEFPAKPPEKAPEIKPREEIRPEPKVEVPPKAEEVEIPAFISKKRKQDLMDLGYSKETIAKMTPKRADEIIKQEAKPTAPAREPWEMSEAEFKHEALTNWYKGKKWFNQEKQLKNIRKEVISDAVEEGKPVPPEVLADYPDLGKLRPTTMMEAELRARKKQWGKPEEVAPEKVKGGLFEEKRKQRRLDLEKPKIAIKDMKTGKVYSVIKGETTHVDVLGRAEKEGVSIDDVRAGFVHPKTGFQESYIKAFELLKPKPRAIKPPEKAKTFIEWVKRTGGIWDPSLKGEMREFTKEESGVPFLVRKTGKPFDTLVTQAIEDGWLPEGSTGNELRSMLREDMAAMRAKKLRVPGPGEITLHGGLPFHNIKEAWTKTVGEPVWDTVIMKKVPALFEKIPGGKAVNRAMLYEYRGNLPNTPGYLASLEDMRRYQAIGRDYAIDLGKRLQAMPEDAQLRMGELIRGEIAPTGLNPKEVKLANEAIRTFYDLGRQAVDVELLREETFFKNAGRYMPRLYTSKEYHQLLTRYGLKKPMRLDLSRFERRMDIPKEIREAMGEILTPGYPVAKGITQLTHDVEMAKFFKGIADNPEWAVPKKAETIPKDFKQLPSNKKLGPLSEAHVHPEIFQEIQETVRIMETPERVWRQLLGVWKIGKIVNPKTMARNLFGGNVLLSHMGGFPIWNQPIAYGKALSQMRKQGEYYIQARKLELLKTTWAKGELQQLFNIEAELAGLRKASLAEGLGAMGRTWEKLLVLSQKGGKAYQALEEWSKLAHYIDAIERRGMTPEKAAEDASKWLFDYGKVTRFQEKYRTKWYGAPFATFTFKALPRIAECVIKTPWRMAVPAALIMAVEKAAQIKIGDTKEERKAKLELRPDWQKGTFLGIPNFARVPLVDDWGREYYWNLTYWLPWGDIGEAGGFGPIPGSLVPMSQPFVKEAFQQIVNYDTFWEKPIVPETELVGKTGIAKYLTEAELRASHLGQSLAPTMAIDITKGIAAIRGRPDIRGRERHPLAVGLDVFGGIKLYPVDYADQMQKQISKYDPKKGFLARKIRSQIRTYGMKRKAIEKKGGNTDFYDKKIAMKIKQLQGLGKEVEEKGEEYKKAKIK